MLSKWKIQSVLALATGVGAMTTGLCGSSVTYAAAPAVTDFGQSTQQAVWVPTGHRPARAAFLTLTADGQAHCEVHTVTDDSMNTFAGGTSWRLDQGLMLFAAMPVYVRDPSDGSDTTGL